jgi:hypothetical protein
MGEAISLFLQVILVFYRYMGEAISFSFQLVLVFGMDGWVLGALVLTDRRF